MIHLPGSVRVYLCLTPCDMRKSFDSLHATRVGLHGLADDGPQLFRMQILR